MKLMRTFWSMDAGNGWYLAVDGGSIWSKAMLFFADDENVHVLSVKAGGSMNPRFVGRKQAAANLNTLVEKVTANGEVKPSSLKRVGVSSVIPAETTKSIVRNICGDKVDVSHIPLGVAPMACSMASTSVCVTAGATSSIVRACLTSGQMVETLNWGWFLNDESSAITVGRKGLQAVLKHVEGGEGTVLTAAAATMFNSGKTAGLRQAIVSTVYDQGTPQWVAGQFAPLVIQASQKNDKLALNIKNEVAGVIAQSAVRARKENDGVVVVGELGFVLSGEILNILENKFGVRGVPGGIIVTPDAVPGIASLILGEKRGPAHLSNLLRLWAVKRQTITPNFVSTTKR